MVETRYRDYGPNPSSSTKSGKKGTTKPIKTTSKKVSKAGPPKAGAVKNSNVQKSKGTKPKAKTPAPDDARALAEMEKVASAKRAVNQKKRAEAKA